MSQKVAYDGVQEAICEITGFFPSISPDRFPLAQVLSRPLIYKTGEAAALGWLDMRAKYPQIDAEFEEVKVLYYGNNEPGGILSRHPEPIRTLEEFQGKLYASWGEPVRIVEMLGGESMLTSKAEIYTQLETGVADAYIGNLGWYREARMDEVVNSITIVGFQSLQLMYIMNKDIYESLPPDLQDIIDDVGDKSVFVGAMFDGYAEEVYDFLREEYPDTVIYELPADERAKWLEKIAPIHDEWVTEANAAGAPGREMLEDFISFCQKYDAEIAAR